MRTLKRNELVALLILLVSILPAVLVAGAMENMFSQTSCHGIHFADVQVPITQTYTYTTSNTAFKAKIEGYRLTAQIVSQSPFSSSTICVSYTNLQSGARANYLADSDAFDMTTPTNAYNGATIHLYANP